MELLEQIKENAKKLEEKYQCFAGPMLDYLARFPDEYTLLNP